MIGCKITKDVGKVQVALFNKKNEERNWGWKGTQLYDRKLTLLANFTNVITAK